MPVREPIRAKTQPPKPARKPIPAPAVVAVDREETPPAPRASPRKIIAAAVVAVLLIVGLVSLRGGNATPAESRAESAHGPFARYIAAPGRVESSTGRRELAFSAGGRIRKLNVKEGDTIAKGAELGTLDSESVQARLSSAEAELQNAQARCRVAAADIDAECQRSKRDVERLAADLALLKAGPHPEQIERARAQLRAAEAEQKLRAEELERSSDIRITPEKERNLARSQAQIAAAQCDVARALLRELESGARKEEIARAQALLDAALIEQQRLSGTRDARLNAMQAQVKFAQAQVDLAQAALIETRLISPVDGVVARKYKEEGETVGIMPPVPVLVVAETRVQYVRAGVDEADILRLRPGQRAKVWAECLAAGAYLDATIERICPEAGERRFSTGEARERQDVKVIETLVKLKDPSALKLGLRATVYFDLE